MLSYVAKHSKQRKTTKVIKLQWIASIWCQKHQTNAKLQKWSYFDEFQSIWRQNYQNIWVRSQNYKSNQITMDCIDLMSKQSKMLSYVVKHSKLRKTTKEIKLQWIASIWHQNDLKCWDTSQNYKCDHITMNLHRFDVKTIKNVELRRKTFKTTQNYESDQITMNCIDLTSKRSRMLSYVAKHSKQRKTTKVIKLQWIASIWCQKHQTNAKLQKWSYFDEFQSIWRQNYQNIWVRSQNYKSNQITMDCIDLMSKQSKMLSYVVKHSKLRKTTKEIKLQWIASIWHQNDLKCWVTSQNYKCDHITMNLHRFDVKTIKNVEVRRKTFKTTQNYKWNQITMNFIDLTSERSKMLSYVAKLQMWSYYDEFASIWRQNDNNNSKLRKWSNYNALHQFDVKTI